MTAITLNKEDILSFSLKTAGTVGMMVFLPILFHIIPFSGPAPLGAYLLPMFIASLIAAFYLSPVGLALAVLLAPVINQALTGMPTAAVLPGLMAELLLFSLVTSWIVRNRIEFIGFSVVAFLATKLVVWSSPLILGASTLPFYILLSGLLKAIPGVLILFGLELFFRWKE